MIPIRIICSILIFMAIPASAIAEPDITLGQSLSTLKRIIETGNFSSRHRFEVDYPSHCQFVLKDINPKCPDQRGEISFPLGRISAVLDSFTMSIEISSPSSASLIKETLYYRNSVRGRRFCETGGGQSLKSDSKSLSVKYLLYTDDADLLESLEESFKHAQVLCQEPTE